MVSDSVYGCQFLARQPPGSPAGMEKVTLHEFPMIHPRTEPWGQPWHTFLSSDTLHTPPAAGIGPQFL